MVSKKYFSKPPVTPFKKKGEIKCIPLFSKRRIRGDY
jgi:hypothetical protein